MELWLVLGALYTLQCLVWLPPGAVSFVRAARSWFTVTGPGWGLLHPLPSGAGQLATRLPLSEREGRLHGPGAPGWLAEHRWNAAGPAVDTAALAGAEARGRVVSVGGHPFARALSQEQAEAIAVLLRALGNAEAEKQRALLEAAVQRSLSLALYRDEKEHVERSTRWLRWSSDLYAIALLAGLPFASALWGTERVLLLSLPGVAALHVSTVAALVRAFRRLNPGRAGALAEVLLATALYPPLLLRAVHDLRTRKLAAFHPATVACAELPPEEGRVFLRREILRAGVRAASAEKHVFGLDAIECSALWRLVGELGETEQTLFARSAPQDPLAESYCPACLCEYRCDSGACVDCGVDLVGW